MLERLECEVGPTTKSALYKYTYPLPLPLMIIRRRRNVAAVIFYLQTSLISFAVSTAVC